MTDACKQMICGAICTRTSHMFPHTHPFIRHRKVQRASITILLNTSIEEILLHAYRCFIAPGRFNLWCIHMSVCRRRYRTGLLTSIWGHLFFILVFGWIFRFVWFSCVMTNARNKLLNFTLFKNRKMNIFDQQRRFYF